ncbi:MAG: hypothetical protein KBD01_11845 [Acidobacteria bacterium]|nr:hypothetical protein [Acidobacteriota bacterium]
MKRLLALLVPAAALAFLALAAAIAFRTGLLKGEDWAPFLWPALVAFALAAFSIIVLVLGQTRWLFPLGTGFVVQFVGLLLVLPNPPWVTWWKTLLATLIAVVLVLLVMLAIWLVVVLRARRLERKLTEGMAGGAQDQEELAKIRANMDEALRTLAKAGGRKKQSIYLLPWFLVVGRSQGGKSTAVKNSGLTFPLRKDRYKGVGGTSIVDFFFTTEMVFLDTPGRWVSEGTDESSKKSWQELVHLLQRYRGQRPIDGVMVVVPANFLLSESEQTLQDDAARIREVLDLMQQELHFRFPVYLLVSKCDLVEGFVDFFRNLMAQKRPEVFGWSNPAPEQGEPRQVVATAFRGLCARLDRLRLEMLVRVGRTRQARRLFMFIEEFKRLQEPLATFADELFYADPVKDAPLFRGFYFTSGTQGEGVPVTAAMAGLAQQLGIRVAAGQDAGEADEPKRAYFLLELFREVMGRDRGLTGRTAVHWLLQRKRVLLYAFAPAVLATLLLLFSGLSFLLNWHAYDRIALNAPAAARALDAAPAGNLGLDVNAALPRTRALMDMHVDVAGFGVFNRMGLRRPGALDAQLAALFRDRFQRRVLQPTLQQAQSAIGSSEQMVSCQAAVETYQSVVSLAMGRRIERHEEMEALTQIWRVSAEMAAENAGELRRQYAYYLRQGGEREPVPGFSLARAAEAIRSRCSDVDALSLLSRFGEFQVSCFSATQAAQVFSCFSELRTIAAADPGRNRLFTERFNQLKDDLETLKESRVQEAERAWELLQTLRVAPDEGNDCLQRFMDQTLPGLRTYVTAAEQRATDCRESLKTLSIGDRAVELQNRLAAIQAQLKSDMDVAAHGFETFRKEACAPTLPAAAQTDFELFRKFVERYIQQRCLDVPMPTVQVAAAPAAAAGKAVREPRATGRVAPRGGGLIVAGASYGREFTAEGWQERKGAWDQQLAAAEGLDRAARASVGATVRSEVSAYGGRFATQWNGYLRALRVNTSRGAAPVLLASLATSPEWNEALAPAAMAARAVSSAPSPPFDAIGPQVDSLARLDGFINTRLVEYQAMLAELGDSLALADRDPVARQAFRDAWQSGQPENALVKLKRWAQMNAGPGLASGNLQGLFLQPVQIAETYLGTASQSGDRLWTDVQQLYGERLAGRFPFSPEAGDNVADPEAVKAVFGAKGGLVTALRQGGSSLGAEAQDWLRRAEAISEALFVPRTDQPRPLKLSFDVESVAFDPKKLQDDLRVDRVLFGLADQTYAWDRENPDAAPVSVPLFEGSAPTAKVTVFIAEKKALGRGWKDPEPQSPPAAQRSGAWAPLQMIAAKYKPESDDSVTWTVSAPYREGQKEKGKMQLTIKVRGEGVAALLDLVKRGLPEPPPASR